MAVRLRDVATHAGVSVKTVPKGQFIVRKAMFRSGRLRGDTVLTRPYVVSNVGKTLAAGSQPPPVLASTHPDQARRGHNGPVPAATGGAGHGRTGSS